MTRVVLDYSIPTSWKLPTSRPSSLQLLGFWGHCQIITTPNTLTKCTYLSNDTTLPVNYWWRDRTS